MNQLFVSISACTNLVHIELHDTPLEHDDVSLLGGTVSRLRSLVYLQLDEIPLDDTMTLYLCRGLMNHPTIRYLRLWDCELNSNCCEGLTQLIPTLKQLKKLDIPGNNLSKPDPKPVLLLQQTAKLYSVTLRI